jgi:hypothetical protein
MALAAANQRAGTLSSKRSLLYPKQHTALPGSLPGVPRQVAFTGAGDHAAKQSHVGIHCRMVEFAMLTDPDHHQSYDCRLLRSPWRPPLHLHLQTATQATQSFTTSA